MVLIATIYLLVICSPVGANPTALRLLSQTQTAQTSSSLQPRLAWKKVFAGRETIVLGPAVGDRVVVFTALPITRDYSLQAPMDAGAFNLKSGQPIWQTQIPGLCGGYTADESRWYAVSSLQAPTDDPRTLEPGKWKAGLIAYNWDNGRGLAHSLRLWRRPHRGVRDGISL